MANTTEFVAVNWNSNQLIDEDSLDQLNANVNWLKNNSLTGQYQQPTGTPTSTGLKILAGKSSLGTSGSYFAALDVYFAKSFTPNSSPVVTASIYSSNQVSAFNIYGLDNSTTIDHRGFKIFLRKIDNTIYQDNSYINWIAVGY